MALSVLDKVSLDHDLPIKKMKSDIESLHLGHFAPRVVQSVASQRGIKGFSFLADNVGKVFTY